MSSEKPDSMRVSRLRAPIAPYISSYRFITSASRPALTAEQSVIMK